MNFSAKHLVMLIGGMIFGFGLAMGGMTKPEVVISFLKLQDLGLMVLMGGAVAVSMIATLGVARILKKPVLGGEFQILKLKIDRNLILGAAVFGVGWGISGICPGSAFASLGTGNYPIIIGLSAMFIGAYFHGRIINQ